MTALPPVAHAHLVVARDRMFNAHAEMERAGHKDAAAVGVAANFISNLLLSNQEPRQ